MTNPTSLPNIYTRPYSLNDDYKRSPQVTRSALWVSSVRYLQSNSSTRCEEWWQFIVTHSTQLEQHHKKLINCFRETTLILFNLTRSNLLSITFDTHIHGYGMRRWVESVADGGQPQTTRCEGLLEEVWCFNPQNICLMWYRTLNISIRNFISVYMPMESTYTCTWSR